MHNKYVLIKSDTPDGFFFLLSGRRRQILLHGPSVARAPSRFRRGVAGQGRNEMDREAAWGGGGGPGRQGRARWKQPCGCQGRDERTGGRTGGEVTAASLRPKRIDRRRRSSRRV